MATLNIQVNANNVFANKRCCPAEFVTVCMDHKVLLSKERLHAAFQMFDADGSGTISSQELASVSVLRDNNPIVIFYPQIFGLNSVDDATWNQILSDVDVNQDGEVC
eukprot:Selendium_serpulae@DN5239_c0_g1_i5.p2